MLSRQLEKAGANLPRTRYDRPLRSNRTDAARSAALAAHEFHPADRSRLTKWLSDRRRLSRLRTAFTLARPHRRSAACALRLRPRLRAAVTTATFDRQSHQSRHAHTSARRAHASLTMATVVARTRATWSARSPRPKQAARAHRSARSSNTPDIEASRHSRTARRRRAAASRPRRAAHATHATACMCTRHARTARRTAARRGPTKRPVARSLQVAASQLRTARVSRSLTSRRPA